MASTHIHINEEPQTFSSSINSDEPIPEVPHHSEINCLAMKSLYEKSDDANNNLKRKMIEIKGMVKKNHSKVMVFNDLLYSRIEDVDHNVDKVYDNIERVEKIIQMIADEVSSLYNKMDKVIDMLTH